MPEHSGKDSNGSYVQYGSRTKYYYQPGNKESLARAKAKMTKQIAAMYANGFKENDISPK